MFASHVLHLTGLLALAGGGAGTTIQVDPGVTAIRTCRLSCVSFRTEYRPREGAITTVISNITHGASSMARHLAARDRRPAS